MRTDYDAVDQYPDYTQPIDVQHMWRAADPETPSEAWDPDEELARILQPSYSADPTPPPLGGERHSRRPVNRRRPRTGFHVLAGKRRIIAVAILIAIITICAVTILTWSISYSYDQLRTIALLGASPQLAQWWPLTVYGPWLLAGLSILRASVQHRTARRSWAVMLISSGTAVALCIGQAPHSFFAMVVVGIPPITALVCFRELVGQFSPRPGPRHASDTVHGSKKARP
ncbi:MULTISPECIES: DUF2637 domain-containing protein [unclassified Streptomyces]|uniref:DUF2637 domain-containing protein n=1 Tax=unclassified Streptomyces TaxID=2593676 RepID=UPI0037F7173A